MEEIKNMTLNLTHAALTTNENTALGVIYLLIATLVMASNGVVIVVIVKSEELHLPTLWNLTFMAAWDFCYGLGFIIFDVPSALLNRFAYPESVIGLAASLGTFFTGQNILNVVLAVMDRYICVCWPMRYAKIITMKRFVIAVCLSVLLNTARMCLIVFPDMDFFYDPKLSICFNEMDTILNTLTSTIFLGVSFGTILFCLVRIIQEFLRSRRRVHTEITEPPHKVFRFSFTIALAAGVFCLSYLPLVVLTLCNFILGRENIPEGLGRFSVVALESNSLWNSIIYAATYRPFREALLRCACKNYYRRQKQLVAEVVA